MCEDIGRHGRERVTAGKGRVLFNKSLTILVPQVSLLPIQRGLGNTPQGSVQL